jgi:hypothetical protein
MATKTKETPKQLEPIKVSNGEKEYTIFFHRGIVLMMDAAGYSSNKLRDMLDEAPLNAMVTLVHYGMLSANPEATMEEAAELVFDFGLTSDFTSRVVDLFTNTYMTAVEGSGKNAKWTME